METALHAAIQVTTGRGGRVEVRASSPADDPARASVGAAASHLHLHVGTEPAAGPGMRFRHPAPRQQEDAPLSAALDLHSQRVVATLLRELDAARQRGAAAEAQLADEQRRQEQEARGRHRGQAHIKQQQQRQLGVAGIQRGPLPRSGPTAPAARIKAFRPPGQAPPPRHPNRPRSPAQPPAPSPLAVGQEFAALQRENAELRGHLGALLSHFQQHMEAAATATAAATGCGPLPAHPAVRSRQRQPAADQVAAAMPGLGGSPRRRPGSPGRTTAVVLSPRAGGADLAVAVFEPPPEDAGDLQLALNRMQRQNLKLSSKLAKAQQEAQERAAEARQWQQAVEQQAGTIGELRVELEGERRRRQDLEAALAAASGEVAAAQQQATALMAQLGAAEAAAATANDEAASLCSQLAVVEERRGRALRESERLREEAAGTAARLNASELVRREAERERNALELQAQRLRAALAEAEAAGAAQAEGLAVQLGAAQQQVAVEQQRGKMLQAQLSLVQAQACDTERVLTEQLRAVQEERNTCLAAATRADQLLVRLGQHALTTRGVD